MDRKPDKKVCGTLKERCHFIIYGVTDFLRSSHLRLQL